MKYPKTINNLIECYKKLPSVGEKSAERFALHTLEMDEELIKLFSKSLLDIKTKIKKCKRCNNLTEEDFCEICKDSSRNSKVLCIVEEPKNVILFEKIDIFNGYYHVLNGLISPLDGVNPEDLNLDNLKERIINEKIEEVILAVKPSVEGETTALYISKMLQDIDVVVSRIAHGVPIGADIDYLDSLTLELALENRNKISKE